mmetsp:Transcript_10550/g.23375  ORF Transcript_10550/g.23375 Transcript_10550/m.23375 type:complete len:90 (-) Transcript_10550:41-310(-)
MGRGQATLLSIIQDEESAAFPYCPGLIAQRVKILSLYFTRCATLKSNTRALKKADAVVLFEETHSSLISLMDGTGGGIFEQVQFPDLMV